MGARGGPPDIQGLTSLKVDNLSYRTEAEDLRRLFERYGEIGDIHIPRDPRTRQSKGFAFVRFYSKRDAEHAMDKCDGRHIDGREIKVAMARYGRADQERRGASRDYRDRDSYRRRSYDRSRSRSRSPRRRSSRDRSKSYSDKDEKRSRSGSRSPSPRGKSRSTSKS